MKDPGRDGAGPGQMLMGSSRGRLQGLPEDFPEANGNYPERWKWDRTQGCEIFRCTEENTRERGMGPWRKKV